MGKLFVVGLGPGGVEQMTKRAYDALKSCDVIAGYNVYVNLIKEDFKEKEFLSNGMRKEVDRCKLALDEALKGKTVAMISSGDAGVYGMASPVLELAQDYPAWPALCARLPKTIPKLKSRLFPALQQHAPALLYWVHR